MAHEKPPVNQVPPPLPLFIPQHGFQMRLFFLTRLISGFEGFPVPFRRFIEVFLCAVPFIAAVFLAEQSRRGFPSPQFRQTPRRQQ